MTPFIFQQLSRRDLWLIICPFYCLFSTFLFTFLFLHSFNEKHIFMVQLFSPVIFELLKVLLSFHQQEIFESMKFWQTRMQYLVKYTYTAIKFNDKGNRQKPKHLYHKKDAIFLCYTLGLGFTFQRSYKSNKSFYSRSLVTFRK